MFVLAFLAAAHLQANADPATLLADEIQTRVENAIIPLQSTARKSSRPTPDAKLVKSATWIEEWPDEPRQVTGKLWSQAIQTTLDAQGAVFVPAGLYYLDEPIVLKSGQVFIADPAAEFRLKPGTNTCLIRNASITGMVDGHIPEVPYDRDIWIEGGIWTSLKTSRKEANGNVSGRPSPTSTVRGCHGAILLNHVKGVVVKNAVIRQCHMHGVQLSDVEDFLVEDITFEDHGRDGVHVHGPSAHGVIRRLRGVTHDDFVALNAWDWANTSPSVGPIQRILVEDVTGDLEHGTAEIRLLPGTRTRPDGSKLDCPVENCVLRRLTDIRTVKAYDQPNLEMGRDKDFSDPIGTLRNIYLRDLTYRKPGVIEIAAHTDGFDISSVRLGFTPAPNFRLVRIGPMSGTYKGGSSDPARWVELFSPDKDITLRAFRLNQVWIEAQPVEDAENRLVTIAGQKPNPDYPNTVPKGGTGQVIRVK